MRLARLRRPLSLVLAACCLALLDHAGPNRQGAPGLEEALGRARLEQGLVLAERTAHMLAELEAALEDWDRRGLTP